jgi:N-acetylglucosamine-6-sulfatase
VRRTPARLSLVLALLPAVPAVASGAAPVRATATASDRPNVVVIMTDDQRFDSLGNCLPSYGGPDGPDSVLCMPNVRALLQDHGVTFTQSFVTTSVCCPSRSSFLTGLYAHNHRVLTNNKPTGGFEAFQGRQSSTLATWLHDAGYRTALIGKYLNGYYGPETPPGWDDWHAVYGSSSSSYTHFKLVENGIVNSYSQTYNTTVLGEKAVDFIQSTPESQPLFLYFAPHAPHYPYQPARGDGQAYVEQPPWRPDSYLEPDISDKPPFYQALPIPDATYVANRDRDQRRQLETLIEVDRQVANIVAALGPRVSNTLFVFASDNGMLWGEHRYFEQKGCEFEECSRVPLVVRFDPLTGGAARVDPAHPALNVDLAPTILDAAGVAGPSGMDGRSLLPLLQGDAPPDWRTATLGENFSSLLPVTANWPPSNSFIETFPGDPADGRYKYVEACDRADHALPCAVAATELYDENADPLELCNLLSPVGCGPAPPAALVEQLAERLHALESARPPTLVVDPPAATSTSPVIVTFGGDGLSRFRCSADGAPLSPCSSPLEPAGQTLGPHSLTVVGDGPGGTAAPGTVRWWISDRIPATPSFTSTPPSRSGPDGSFSFTDTEAGVTFRCSLDGALAEPCTSPTGLQGLALGPHTFSVSALDGDGNLSFPASFGWTVLDDLTPPTLTMKLPAADSFRSSRGVAVQWSGDDGTGSGIARYDVAERVGLGGDPSLVHSGPATSFTVNPADTGTYCFRVTAFDHEGNSTTGPQRCTAVPLDDRDLSFSGPVTLQSPTGAFDGTVTRMTGPGGASFSFTGRRVGVLFREGPDLGKAAVSVDGGTPKLVDLYDTSTKGFWWTRAFDGSGPHVVRVAWSRQHNDSSTGLDVAVDGVAAIADAPPVPT